MRLGPSAFADVVTAVRGMPTGARRRTATAHRVVVFNPTRPRQTFPVGNHPGLSHPIPLLPLSPLPITDRCLLSAAQKAGFRLPPSNLYWKVLPGLPHAVDFGDG